MIDPQHRPVCWLLCFKSNSKKKKKGVKNSVSFTRLFWPRCVLNFVRIINRVSKHEDKLALWPLMRRHNSSERFIAPRVSSVPHYPSHSFNSIRHREQGGKVGVKTGWFCGCGMWRWKALGPPLNTILLSSNHSLQETKSQLIWKTRLTRLS